MISIVDLPADVTEIRFRIGANPPVTPSTPTPSAPPSPPAADDDANGSAGDAAPKRLVGLQAALEAEYRAIGATWKTHDDIVLGALKRLELPESYAVHLGTKAYPASARVRAKLAGEKIEFEESHVGRQKRFRRKAPREGMS